MSDIDKLLKQVQEETYTFKIPLLSDKNQEVEIRTIKTKDQKSLTVESQEVKNDIDKLVLLLKLLDKCIVKNSKPLGDMLFEDFLWLLIKLRSKSFGEEITLKSNCKHCTYDNNTVTINLEKDIIINYLENLQNKPIQLTPSITLSLGFITVNEALEILKFELEEDKTIATFATMIKQIELNEEILDINLLEEKMLFLEELSETDLEKFMTFLENNEFGLNIKTSFNCGGKIIEGKENNGCGRSNEVELNGFEIISFF